MPELLSVLAHRVDLALMVLVDALQGSGCAAGAARSWNASSQPRTARAARTGALGPAERQLWVDHLDLELQVEV